MRPARVSFAILLAAAACGGTPDGGDPAGPDGGDGCADTGRYLELGTGKSWTYKVIDTADGTVTQKTQTVGALEDISSIHPGVMAYRLTTTKPSGSTDSWQEDTGTAIRRHRENDNSGSNVTAERYDPYRTRIDETPAHLVLGARWSESYTELVTAGAQQSTADKVEQWAVAGVDEMLTVPAGTFCTLHLQRTSTVGGLDGSSKEYWFARGIGKIKERGGGQVEELTSYRQ